MKIAIFGKSPISENKCILKLTMFIPNMRITRKALVFIMIPSSSLQIHMVNTYTSSGRTMALGSTQPQTNEYQEHFLGGKGGRCVGLTTLSPSCFDCLESWESQPPGTLTACTGIALPLHTYTCLNVSSR